MNGVIGATASFGGSKACMSRQPGAATASFAPYTTNLMATSTSRPTRLRSSALRGAGQSAPRKPSIVTCRTHPVDPTPCLETDFVLARHSSTHLQSKPTRIGVLVLFFKPLSAAHRPRPSCFKAVRSAEAPLATTSDLRPSLRSRRPRPRRQKCSLYSEHRIGFSK